MIINKLDYIDINSNMKEKKHDLRNYFQLPNTSKNNS